MIKKIYIIVFLLSRHGIIADRKREKKREIMDSFNYDDNKNLK